MKSVQIRSFSVSYFPAFGLNTEKYGVFLRTQSECWKIRTRRNSIFGHFSRSVYADFITKWDLCSWNVLQRRESFINQVVRLFYITKQGQWYYKVGQVSQCGTIFIAKWEQELQSRSTFITKWRRHCNVVQLLRIREEQEANKRNWGGQQILAGNWLLNSTLTFLVTDNFPLGIPEKLTFC